MRCSPVVLLLISLMAATGCQVGGRQSSESRFANEQTLESYIDSPAYKNVQLGIEYMNRGDLGVALEKLKKALVQSPEFALAHNTTAALYEKMGESELAKQHYERSIRLDSNDPKLRNNYGQFLCQHGSELEGIRQLDIAAKNPLYKTPYLPLTNAGRCALWIDQGTMAEDYFLQALEKNPKWVPALSGMIQVSLNQSKYLQGKDYIQRYTALAKHSPATLWAGYQIEKNMGDKEASANYAVRLKSRFPNSKETRLLLRDIAPK